MKTLLSRYDVFIVYKFSVYDLNFPSYDLLLFFMHRKGLGGVGRRRGEGGCAGKEKEEQGRRMRSGGKGKGERGEGRGEGRGKRSGRTGREDVA